MRRLLAISAGLITSYVVTFIASFIVSFLVTAAGGEYQATPAIRTIYEIVGVVGAILVAFWVDGRGKTGKKEGAPVVRTQPPLSEITRPTPRGLT